MEGWVYHCCTRQLTVVCFGDTTRKNAAKLLLRFNFIVHLSRSITKTGRPGRLQQYSSLGDITSHPRRALDTPSEHRQFLAVFLLHREGASISLPGRLRRAAWM